ncbi:MAG: TonB-dependent receptor [Acidobacteriota bacterium]
MFRFWTILVSVCLFPLTALAESVSGTVADPRGAPVAGIRLILLQDNTPISSTLTDPQGSYRFEELVSGIYQISIHELGFEQEKREFEVGTGEELRHDLMLSLKLLEEKVVVTGTRTASPRNLLGNSISVITAEEIEAQGGVTLGDVLRTVPGVTIAQSGGPGSLSSIFLRGGESNYTKVLVDGIPLNKPGGAIDLSNISLTNVERIEVVRGPQSALYGSDAISGVIQILSKKGTEEGRPRFDLFLEGGTFDTLQAGTSLAGRLEKLSYSLAFQHFSTDTMEPNDFFRHNSFASLFEIETSRNSSLTLVGRLERGRSGVPGPTAFGRPDLEEFSRKRDFALSASWNQTLSDSWQHRMAYSQSYSNVLSEDLVDSGPYIPRFEGREAAFSAFDFPISSLNATRKHLLNYQSDFFLNTHSLSAGFEYEHQRGTISDLRATRDNFGYYIQDQFILGQRLAVTAGLRLEDNDSFGLFASPRVSLSYLLREGGAQDFWGATRPKFNFGLGIKEPTFLESFSPNFFFQGNPDLDPEKSRSFEVGLEQSLARNRLQAQLNLFHNLYEDQIAFVVLDFSTFEGTFLNTDKSQAWGIEQTLQFAPSANLHFGGGYTYLNSKVVEILNPFSPVFEEGSQLLRRPAHSGFLTINWSSGRFHLNSHIIFNGKRTDSDFLGLGLTEVDGYTKWDLSGSFRMNPKLELYTTLRNILNQEYFEVLGFPALKFHFRSGLRLSF